MTREAEARIMTKLRAGETVTREDHVATIDDLAELDAFKAGEFAGVRQAVGRGQGRVVAAAPLPRSTVAAWGPDDLGAQLSKWQFGSDTDFEPSALPTRARPANARRKG